ncbi:WD40 repeat domain-containing protein [Actinoplanes sp. URMC 104]|uniref:WD40 repeat domain-containing protein n=1 Tax=Actinoplanes sp. URMC 104 TaxID=3423409 RepID=UPI003F1A4B1E
MGEIVADLTLQPDPDLALLAQGVERCAHLLRDTSSRPHRVDTALASLCADPRTRSVAERCMRELGRVNLRLAWAVQPSTGSRSHTLQRHGERVVSCRFSADDRYLVSVDRGGVVILWDVASGASVAVLDSREAWADARRSAFPAARHPDVMRMQYGFEQTYTLVGGRDQLALVTSEGVLTVWSLADEIVPLYVSDTARDGYGSARFVFAVDRETFMSRSDDVLRLHSWESGTVLLTMPVDGGTARSAFNGANDRVAVEAQPGLIEIWDLAERRLAGRIDTGYTDDRYLDGLALDGNLLFVVDDEGFAALWDWPRGRRIGRFRGVFDQPQVDASTGILRWLSRPGELVVTDVRSGGTFRARGPVAELPADADDYGRATLIPLSDRMLATVMNRQSTNGGDAVAEEHRVDFFEPDSGRCLATGWGEGSVLLAVAGATPGQLLIATNHGEFETWDLAADDVGRIQTAAGARAISAAVSGDRRTAAVTSSNDVLFTRLDGDRSKDRQQSARGLIGRPVTVLADPAGRWFATVTDQRYLDVWDPLMGLPQYACHGSADLQFESAPQFPAFSPDGRWIAVEDWDHSIIIWDPSTGRQLDRLGPQDGTLVHAAATRSGPAVFRRYYRGDLVMWDVRTRRRVVALPPADKLAGDVSGTWLATLDKDGTASVWSLADGRLQHAVKNASGMAADPTGRGLFVWDGGHVRVIRLPDGAVEGIATVPAGVATVLVNATGSRRVLVGRDGSIQLLLPESTPLNVRSTLAGDEHVRWRLSPGGRLLGAVGLNGKVEVIDLDRPGTRASATAATHVAAAAFVADTSFILTGDFGVQSMILGNVT